MLILKRYLSDGQDVFHEKHVMAWSMNADPLLYQMDYRNGSLIIQKEGYYNLYSKVFFSEGGMFHHFVSLRTERYPGEIILLQARNYSPSQSRSKSNSFLGGVFHLFRNDAVYVNVSDARRVVRHRPFENVFGAYMI